MIKDTNYNNITENITNTIIISKLYVKEGAHTKGFLNCKLLF